TCTSACTSIGNASLDDAVATIFLPTRARLTCTSPASARSGAFLVRNATALHEPTSFSPALHATCANLTVPGPMSTTRERSSSAGPAGVTRAETVERPPPPCVGTQPRSGWNAWTLGAVETARNIAYRVVVTP